MQQEQLANLLLQMDGRAMRYVISLVRNPTDAEDIVSETRYKVLRASVNIRSIEATWAYYKMALHNTVVTQFQRNARKSEPEFYADCPESESSPDCHDEYWERHGFEEIIRSLPLPVDDKKFLFTLVLSGKTHRDIAELYGSKTKAFVSRRLARIREKIENLGEGAIV